MVLPLHSAAAQFYYQKWISIFLETRISISIRRRGMFCSRLTGAWNQFIATQYSVVCYYGIMWLNWCNGVGKGCAGGLKNPPPPPDFKFMLLCVEAVTTNGHPKFIIIEKQKRIKQLSSYKQCYIYKKQNLEVSKYMNLALACYVQQTRS